MNRIFCIWLVSQHIPDTVISLVSTPLAKTPHGLQNRRPFGLFCLPGQMDTMFHGQTFHQISCIPSHQKRHWTHDVKELGQKRRIKLWFYSIKHIYNYILYILGVYYTQASKGTDFTAPFPCTWEVTLRVGNASGRWGWHRNWFPAVTNVGK